MFLAQGTWDDDCVGRYYNTLNAFNEPKHFVSIWNRPLFTIVFCWFAFMGKYVISILMIGISTFSALFLYKGLKVMKAPNAFVVIPFLLFQVFFFGLSRNMETEPLAVRRLRCS